VFVIAFHRDLRAASWFAHDTFHFNDAACEFGHFGLKKFCEKARVRAREPDKSAACAFVHAQKKGAHALALPVALTGYLLVVGEDRGRAAEVYVEVAALEALHVARYDVALALAVFRNDARALRLAHFLQDDLLCGLRRDATEILARFERKTDLLIELRVFFDAAGVFEHDVLLCIETGTMVLFAFRLLVFHAYERFVDDNFGLTEFHLAGSGIESGADYLPALSVFAAVSRR
jgi:hypothetical protein